MPTSVHNHADFLAISSGQLCRMSIGSPEILRGPTNGQVGRHSMITSIAAVIIAGLEVPGVYYH